MQNYLSFLGTYNKSNQKNKEILNSLPKQTINNKIISKGNFFLNIYIPDNHLYDQILIETDIYLLFINGFFYEKPNSEFFKNLNLGIDKSQQDILKNIVHSLNGNFNGFFLNLKKNELVLFTDSLGFEKIYYTQHNNGIVFSSFIWPLLKLNSPQYNKTSLASHLLLGHSLSNKTLFNSIYTIQPDKLEFLNLDGSYKKSVDICKTYLINNNSNFKEKAEEFLELSHSHFSNINKSINISNWGTTLTGGGDTRVMLNAMLNENIKPHCFSGHYENNVQDANRSNKLAKSLNLKLNLIDFSDLKDADFFNILKLSNGYLNGIWLSVLAKKAFQKTEVLYYGFSGDLLAGGNEFTINSNMSFEQMVLTTLKYKSYYKESKVKDICNLVDIHPEDFLEEYFKTFDYKGKSFSDRYYLQEKNERSNKRIASFADGSKFGPSNVYFFHDKKIKEFYLTLPKKFLKNELMHNKLAYYKNLKLGLHPSANKTFIPHFLIPVISNLINKDLLIKYKNYMSPPKHQKITFTNTDKLKNLLNKNLSDELMFDDFTNYNFSNFINSKNEHLVSDMNTLKMRMLEINLTHKIK